MCKFCLDFNVLHFFSQMSLLMYWTWIITFCIKKAHYHKRSSILSPTDDPQQLQAHIYWHYIDVYVGTVYVEPELCAAPSRFSPELLGVQASSALVWLIMEVLAVLLSLYLVAINTDLTTIDLLAFSGYKYVGYVISLCFISLSILYFMFYFVLKHIYSFFSSLIWYC